MCFCFFGPPLPSPSHLLLSNSVLTNNQESPLVHEDPSRPWLLQLPHTVYRITRLKDLSCIRLQIPAVVPYSYENTLCCGCGRDDLVVAHIRSGLDTDTSDPAADCPQPIPFHLVAECQRCSMESLANVLYRPRGLSNEGDRLWRSL